jgi:hypothetical protein
VLSLVAATLAMTAALFTAAPAQAAGVVLLGHEPQPINRDFRLLNTTDGPLSVMLDLECLAIETGSPHDEVINVTNTATAGTTTFEPDLADNTDSASMLLTVSPGSAGPAVQSIRVADNGSAARVTARCRTTKVCSGTMVLTAKVRSGGHQPGGHRGLALPDQARPHVRGAGQDPGALPRAGPARSRVVVPRPLIPA